MSFVKASANNIDKTSVAIPLYIHIFPIFAIDLTNNGVSINLIKLSNPTNFQSASGVVTLFALNILMIIVLKVGYKKITIIRTTAGSINIRTDLFVCFIKVPLFVKRQRSIPFAFNKSLFFLIKSHSNFVPYANGIDYLSQQSQIRT